MNTEDSMIDREVEEAWYRLSDGIHVDVLDIPSIFKDIKLAMASGMWVDAAVLSVLVHYRAEV